MHFHQKCSIQASSENPHPIQLLEQKRSDHHEKDARLFIFRLLLLLLFLVSLSDTVQASQTIVLSKDFTNTCICRDNVDVFEDTTANLTLEEVKKQSFIPGGTAPDPLVNEHFSSAYWIKFDVVDLVEEDHTFIVEVYDFDLDHISFYSPDSTGEYNQLTAGYKHDFNQRDLHHKNCMFTLNALDSDTTTVYMRFQSSRRNVLKPILKSYSETLSYSLNEYILFGVFYGLMLLMIFYNFLYYIILRKLHYLYYVFFALGILIFLVSQNGTGFQYIWPSLPQVNPYIGEIGLFVGILMMLLFTINFLNLKAKDRLMYNVLLGAIVLRTIVFIPQLIISSTLTWSFLDVVFIQAALFAALRLWNTDYLSVRWFVVAFMLLNMSFIITFLEKIGWLPSGIFTVYALNIGIVLQFVFLSISIAESVKLTYRQRNEAQAKLIEEYKKTQDLKEKIQSELEQKVEERTRALVAQKSIAEEQNRHIMASVRYAQTIQKALLPSRNSMESILLDYFVLYLPRDVVSGDFYWAYVIDEHRYLIVAADCTGHGVPGALMSMIGVNLLNRIVSEEVYEPSAILASLHTNIQAVLNQKASGNLDGMDIAICLVDRNQKEIKYSGAKNPMVYVKKDEIHKIKATRKTVGGADQDTYNTYEQHVVSFKDSPVSFYLYSDGYIDQFGGAKGKKFLSKNLLKLLHQYAHEPFIKQQETLHYAIKQWMDKAHPQIDDILVLGVREV